MSSCFVKTRQEQQKSMRIFIFVGLLAVALAKKTFFGDQVLTLHIENEAQAKVIRDMEMEIDLWYPYSSSQVRAGVTADVRITSAMLPAFKTLMRRNKISFEVKIDDLQKSLDAQTKSRERGFLPGNTYAHYHYHRFEEIDSWAYGVAAANSVAERISLTTSFEGRDIPMLKLSTNDNNPAILLECGMHAREWISPSFCQYYADQLLGAEKDKLNDVTYFIIPCANPDGYEYSWTNDRMWRKTRSQYAGNRCVGTDGNRNFDAGFGGEGSSPNSCTQTYRGPAAESEPEVKAVADFVRANKDLIKNYVSFHSYGQMILYPYSYTYNLPPTAATLDKYAAQGTQAIASVSNAVYIYGPGASTIYPAAGGSDDFAYDTGVPLAYTVELPDTGTYGFALPEDQIIPTCQETSAMMEVMYQAVLDVTVGAA